MSKLYIWLRICVANGMITQEEMNVTLAIQVWTIRLYQSLMDARDAASIPAQKLAVARAVNIQRRLTTLRERREALRFRDAWTLGLKPLKTHGTQLGVEL